MSSDALFQLGIVSVFLNTSQTETPVAPSTPALPRAIRRMAAHVRAGHPRSVIAAPVLRAILHDGRRPS